MATVSIRRCAETMFHIDRVGAISKMGLGIETRSGEVESLHVLVYRTGSIPGPHGLNRSVSVNVAAESTAGYHLPESVDVGAAGKNGG